MQIRILRLLFMFFGVPCLAACVTGTDTVALPSEEEVAVTAEAPVQLTFDMAQARAAMDAVSFDNPARLTPVWSADGSRFGYLYGSDVRVRNAANGALELELKAADLAAQISVPADQLNIEIAETLTHLNLSADGQHWTLALSPTATPQPAEAPPEAQVVRKMFPMNGYDRRESLAPNGEVFASLKGRDLALRAINEETPRAITSEPNPYVQWFHGNDIWENSGSIWNDRSTHFIARRHDARETPGLLSHDHLGKSETLTDFRYWARAGDPLPSTTLFAVNAKTGALPQLGAPSGTDAHLFFIEWAPDGQSILAIRYERDLSKQTIVSIDVATGEARTLYERTVDKGWVKWPSGPRTIRHLEDGTYLLRTDEAGVFDFVILDSSGEFVRTLTRSDVDVGDVISLDEAGGWLYYLAPANEDRPYDQIPHRIRLDGGEPQALTQITGVFTASMNPSNDQMVWIHSDTDRASQAELVSTDGSNMVTIETVPTPSSILGAPLPEDTIFESFDGSVVHATILKPADFDPDKTYPVIHRVYGAMQSKVKRTGFWPEGLGWPGSEYYSMLNYLAQQGFVIVLMDPPGTPGRGRAYNLAQWGLWPGNVADHYVHGLRELAKTRPWMDLNRVGVDGNSWGGYIALHTALERPELYRASAISVPETDLLDHVHWIEWQLGTPDDNPDAYASGALQNRAKELASDLLIVAGTSDANVPVSNTMKLLDALAEHGKPYELVMFPGTNHPHQGRGDRYAYAVERIRHFFSETLEQNDPAE